MSAPPRGGTLDGMDISTHPLPDADPVDTGWVDAALSTAYAAGDPVGALVGCPLDGGDGLMLAGWPDPAPDLFEQPYALVEALAGQGAGPARFMQVVAFDGPRSPEWVAAEQAAAHGRLWPAVREVPGIVWTLRLRAADGGTSVVTLAETADAIDAAVRAVMSTSLLPGEDPRLLTGPDRMGVYRLMHADLPIPAAGGSAGGGA
ncbi:hypothetical protein Daura_37670 [Dactylosporangium aurantiacum]|uniref:Uncharacterized protein n=1 Tax=Dactylosporangium aurantiacum TaxID=35754 RepID=A0A9Q9IFP8_9ACTN|nr:hypothetical protein [Dactylosporangium aurantiacum]MDG6101852.1 hypothetical protein [Dactylosporangium aurantiacum]UWZ52348.1 hypothetical protein Daura_37670 [Dactylosporangium aurantiacum]